MKRTAYISIAIFAVFLSMIVAFFAGSHIPVAEQVKVADIFRQCLIAIIAVNGAWCVVLVPIALSGVSTPGTTDKAHTVLSVLSSSLLGLFCSLILVVIFQISASVCRLFPFFVEHYILFRQAGLGVLTFIGIMSVLHIFITLFAPMDFGLKLSFFANRRNMRS